jgi:hypothetical protein
MREIALDESGLNFGGGTAAFLSPTPLRCMVLGKKVGKVELWRKCMHAWQAMRLGQLVRAKLRMKGSGTETTKTIISWGQC